MRRKYSSNYLQGLPCSLSVSMLHQASVDADEDSDLKFGKEDMRYLD